MRDLVESVIGQVMKKNPTMKPLAQNTVSTNMNVRRAEQPVEIKDKDMWDACCQFEAIFMQQMMEAMRKTVPESEMTPKSYATSTFESMMDQAISESGSKQAPLGLAMTIYKQLQQDGQEAGGGAPSIQDIRQATDKLQGSDVIENPVRGKV